MLKNWKLVFKSGLITFAVGLLLVILAFFGLVWVLNAMSIADCAWNGTAVAWTDANRNGSFDPGEQPLPGITLHVEDIPNHLSDVAYAPITDAQGRARLEVPMPGCPKVDLEVYADTPSGYRLTTTERLHVKQSFFGGLEENATYYFGFAKNP